MATEEQSQSALVLEDSLEALREVNRGCHEHIAALRREIAAQFDIIEKLKAEKRNLILAAGKEISGYEDACNDAKKSALIAHNRELELLGENEKLRRKISSMAREIRKTRVALPARHARMTNRSTVETYLL